MFNAQNVNYNDDIRFQTLVLIEINIAIKIVIIIIEISRRIIDHL